MILRKWEELPDNIKIDSVRPYYDALKKKRFGLVVKRIFDVVASFLMLILLSPVFIILAIAIKLDSKGPVFYRQTRITTYGREFRIFKFRTMVQNADRVGAQVTVNNDRRITRVGRLIRRCRLDEICQLIDVLRGTMSFVGTRPEVPKYVSEYTPEMMATLLLPAGITSEASVRYKDEDRLLSDSKNVDETYVKEVLPGKMYYNLRAIKNFSFFGDIKIMFMTVFAVLGKDYSDKANTDSKEV